MEQDAIKDLIEDDKKEKYDRFMKSERHEKDDIKTDPENGMRYQNWDIGMVRNAKPKDKKIMKVYLDPIPHILLSQNVPLRGWYKNKTEPPRIRPRPCYTEAILTSPYGGTCSVKCSFCYINHGVKGYRGQGVTTVDLEYPKKVRRQLKRMRTSAAGYFSSFIDPFIELEEIYHNSQEGASAFVDEGLPIFFLTRKKYPGWAIDLLKQNPYSYAQMSINTSDPEAWKKLSPKALPLGEMYAQVRELKKQGIYISIQVNPIIPGAVSNYDIRQLIHDLARLGADHLIFKFVEISYPSKKALIDIIAGGHGKEAGIILKSLFTCNIGGQATIEEEYRLKALDLFKTECKKAGVTMATCYEYKFERDPVTGEKVSATGVSVGGDYLTADQCHGHKVPMYTRINEGDPFTEVVDCPPNGCLTCSDTEADCGFDEAKALQPKDLLTPIKRRVHGDDI